MLSSNGTQVTIQYFLNLIKAQSSAVSPSIFIMDRDQAQVNSIWAVFPECCCMFYFWWHVLQAIWTHFNMKEFPDLWSLIQDWVHTTNDNEFNACWKYIKQDIVHQSQRAWPNTSLRIGSPIRKCGLQCHNKIAQYLRRAILICC
jgi:hypothetical protein